MKIYDTLSRGLVELPEPPGPVRMYFCGPTVYQRIHVGNAVPFVLPLWLARWLQRNGYETKFVINITDINDKIYNAAPGASARLEDATRWYVEDTDRPGRRPDAEPTAVETVADQIGDTEELVEQGYAYESDGDVYFRVARFADYGGLSGQRPEEVQEQEPNPRKEDSRDFALWKANKPGEDTWWSRRGRGRPGWHIECSVMSEKHLGPESPEIHGGGLDLVFPHHENERAQSGALGHRFARVWMHNGMLEFGGVEMHKSVGNDVSLKDALDRWGRETLLLFFLTDTLAQAARVLGRDAERGGGARRALPRCVSRAFASGAWEGAWERFAAALDDDFNTPEALPAGCTRAPTTTSSAVRLMPSAAFAVEQDEAPADVVSPAERRRQARSSGDFAAADRLREELAAAGGDVRDVAGEPGFQPSFHARDPGARVRPERRARGSARPTRVLEPLGDRACCGDARLARRGRGCRSSASAELTEAAGSPDHSGRGRLVRAVQVRGCVEFAGGPTLFVVCLDQVTDPHLGAVARSAAAAGASGVVVPAHGLSA